jgi:hypothetical protein
MTISGRWNRKIHMNWYNCFFFINVINCCLNRDIFYLAPDIKYNNVLMPLSSYININLGSQQIHIILKSPKQPNTYVFTYASPQKSAGVTHNHQYHLMRFDKFDTDVNFNMWDNYNQFYPQLTNRYSKIFFQWIVFSATTGFRSSTFVNWQIILKS